MTDDLANVIRKLDDLEETRKALGAAGNETCAEAARHVAKERDEARYWREESRSLAQAEVTRASRLAGEVNTLHRHLDEMRQERDEALTKLKSRDGSLEPRIATLERTLGQIGEILGMEEGEGVVDAAKRLASFGHRGQAALCDMDRAREALAAGPRETCATAAERVLANTRSEVAGVNRMLEDARSLANAAMKERDEALEKIRTIDTAIGRDGDGHGPQEAHRPLEPEGATLWTSAAAASGSSGTVAFIVTAAAASTPIVKEVVAALKADADTEAAVRPYRTPVTHDTLARPVALRDAPTEATRLRRLRAG